MKHCFCPQIRLSAFLPFHSLSKENLKRTAAMPQSFCLLFLKQRPSLWYIFKIHIFNAISFFLSMYICAFVILIKSIKYFKSQSSFPLGKPQQWDKPVFFQNTVKSVHMPFLPICHFFLKKTVPAHETYLPLPF